MENSLFADLPEFSAGIKSDFNNRHITDFWKRYDDTLCRMSKEQVEWVSEQKKVVESKNKLISAFLDFLFIQNKDIFVAYNNGQYKEIADNYIDTIQNVSNDYVSRAKYLEEQVKELTQKITKLEAEKNEKKHGEKNGTFGFDKSTAAK